MNLAAMKPEIPIHPSQPSKPTEPQRLYLQIADHLRTMIASGEFAVGSRLPAERGLAIALGVSRPSVREALIALEVSGLIEVRTGSGIYVTHTRGIDKPAKIENNTDEWGPLEVISARLVVEAEIAAMAAKHASKADLQAIKQALQKMKQEVARSEVPRWGDEAFHLAIAHACGNSVLLNTLENYWKARDNPLFKRIGDYFENPESWQITIAEHQCVLDAITLHNPNKARKAMQRHLKLAHKRYSVSWLRASNR